MYIYIVVICFFKKIQKKLNVTLFELQAFQNKGGPIGPPPPVSERVKLTMLKVIKIHLGVTLNIF
jgi:hypothetical protein